MRHRHRPTGAKPPVALFLSLLCLACVIGSGPAGTIQAGIEPRDPILAEDTSQSLALRVYFRDAAERDSLAAQFGVEHLRTDLLYLTVWADRAGYAGLLARGLRVEIDHDLTQRAHAAQPGKGGPDTFYGGYRKVEEIEALLDGYVATYPTLAEKVDIGDPWCKARPGQCTLPEPYNGYDLWTLRISNRTIPGPKPVFWFDAGIHAREIATPEVAIRFIEHLLRRYGQDADATWLVDHHDVWVMPVLNPDGHHIVEAGGGGEEPYLQRKTADNDDGCSAWPPTGFTQFGIDLNRNFPYRWGCCNQSSPDPCEQTYRGPSPGSGDETRAVIAKVGSLIPDQRGELYTDAAPITTTGVFQSMHSYGNVNLYPSTFVPQPIPNAGDMLNIAHHMSAPEAGGNNYGVCEPPGCYSVIEGASPMWAYGELGVPSFLTEISGGFFLPPFEEVETIWNENRGMLLHLAKIARTPYLTTRGPDANSVRAEPGVVLPGGTVVISATINYAWSGNRYAQNVAAADYYIDTPPWAGGTPITMQPSDGAFNSQTENVEAQLDTTGLPVGRHIIFVRGRGVNDYEGYQSWGPVSAAFLDIVSSLPTPTITTVPSSTSTPTPTRSATHVPTGTTTPIPATPSPTAISPTPAACTLSFTDVPTDHTFYANIRCLACRGIISGYADGTFRPGNDITRGQISKMVSNAAGFQEPVEGQSFEDVPPASPFYVFIERLYLRGHMSGYQCGIRDIEPCVPPLNRPYFRPNESATRGQLSKIVCNAAGCDGAVSGQFYADVDESNTFYSEIMRLTYRGVMSGYPCGQLPHEPCDAQQRSYFRWGNSVTRGQASKIVANTFFPGCEQ